MRPPQRDAQRRHAPQVGRGAVGAPPNQKVASVPALLSAATSDGVIVPIIPEADQPRGRVGLIRSELLNQKLACVRTLLMEATGNETILQAIPDADPAECGLVVSNGVAVPSRVIVDAALGPRWPVRIYLDRAFLERMLESGPDRLALAMQLLDIDRLVVFGLSCAATETSEGAPKAKPADGLASLIDRLRTLGFRSPRMSLTAILDPAVAPVALSFIYVQPPPV